VRLEEMELHCIPNPLEVIRIPVCSTPYHILLQGAATVEEMFLSLTKCTY
jgi:hypothetical protein